MADQLERQGLRLPSLRILGFRGIDNFSVPQLGRVTLLAGRNGVGKTTVLEAVRVYASRGRPAVMSAILQQRDELSAVRDEDDDVELAPDYSALFHGRLVERDTEIRIGPANGSDVLSVGTAVSSDWPKDQLDLFGDWSVDLPVPFEVRALVVNFRGERLFLPWVIAPDDVHREWRTPRPSPRMRHRRPGAGWPAALDCESLGPGLLGNQRLAQLWNDVALTEDEERATEALRMIRGNAIERVAVVGDDSYSYRRAAGQRVLVKLADNASPVPLRSLGDGATRLFGVALALANSKNGFLVIDESENGIHHSVQSDFWSMVLATSQKNNVQVLATTHSWDCVRGFARAATQDAAAEGLLVRMESGPEGMKAVTYDEDELQTAADQNIEVR